MSKDDVKPLEDPKAMRALAHPVRLRIRELLGEEGPMTATEVAERIGETPANCSFHLRTLAKYGFIEEAERGKGRNRPWRAKGGSTLIEPENLTGNARRAAIEMTSAIRRLMFERIERWAREQLTLPKRWRKVGFSMEFSTRMTPDELKQVGEEIGKILEPYKRKPPEGAEPVTLAIWGFPTIAPGEDGDD